MKRKVLTLNLAGIPVTCSLRYENTMLRLQKFLQEPEEKPGCMIELTREELQRSKYLYPTEYTEELLEYNELVPRVSEVLLPYRRCLFHGVSFLWRGKTYIFTGPSGTGKTTQYILWKLLLRDEIKLLNGDKPILHWQEDGEIWVYPSPWRGKEELGTMMSAPLGGIILLEQGSENSVELLEVKQAVFPIFCQFLFAAETDWAVQQVAKLEEELLQRIPVWKFVNRGDRDCAKVCSDAIRKFEEGNL